MEGPDATPPPSAAPARLEGWIRTMRADPMLQPLLAVIILHAVAFLVPVCLLAVRSRNPFAALALAILLVASGSSLYGDWQRLGRPGPVGWVLVVLWVGAALASVLTSRFLLC